MIIDENWTLRAGCFIAVAAVALLASCSNSTSPGTTPAGSGVIKGTVKLSRADGKEPPSAAGVTVSAVNKSLTTTTDADGSWSFSGLPAGVYRFTFSKSDAEPWDQSHTPIQAISPGVDTTLAETVFLSLPLKASVRVDSSTLGDILRDTVGMDSLITGSPANALFIWMTVQNLETNPDTLSFIEPYGAVLFSTDPQINAAKLPSAAYYQISAPKGFVSVPFSQFRNYLGARSGQIIYWRAAALNNYGRLSYDPTKGSRYDPATTSAQSEVHSFVMP